VRSHPRESDLDLIVTFLQSFLVTTTLICTCACRYCRARGGGVTSRNIKSTIAGNKLTAEERVSVFYAMPFGTGVYFDVFGHNVVGELSAAYHVICSLLVSISRRRSYSRRELNNLWQSQYVTAMRCIEVAGDKLDELHKETNAKNHKNSDKQTSDDEDSASSSSAANSNKQTSDDEDSASPRSTRKRKRTTKTGDEDETSKSLKMNLEHGLKILPHAAMHQPDILQHVGSISATDAQAPESMHRFVVGGILPKVSHLFGSTHAEGRAVDKLNHDRGIMDAIKIANHTLRNIPRRVGKTPPDVHLMKAVQSDVFEMHGDLDEFLAVTAPVTRGEMRNMITQLLLDKDLEGKERKKRERIIHDRMHLLSAKFYQCLRMKTLVKSNSYMTIWATDSKYIYNKSGRRRDFVHLAGVENKKFRRGRRSADITITGQVQTFVELRGFKQFMQCIGPDVICIDQTQAVAGVDLMELVLVRYLAPHPHCTHPLVPSNSPACGSLPLVHGLWEFAKISRTGRKFLHRRGSFETHLRRQLGPASSSFTAVPPADDAGRAWYGLHVVRKIKRIMDIGIASGIDPPGFLECVARY